MQVRHIRLEKRTGAPMNLGVTVPAGRLQERHVRPEQQHESLTERH